MSKFGLKGVIPEYEVKGQVYQNTLSEDLAVNESNLNEEFAMQAEKFAWYSTMYEFAAQQEDRLKLELQRVSAFVEQEIRATTMSKVTEKSVSAMVTTHYDVVAAHDALMEAQLITGFLKAARDAMSHRRDMLVQLGANVRASNDLYLKK